MILVMIVEEVGMVRGALAETLSSEPDLRVTATLSLSQEDPVRAARSQPPAVIVIDARHYGAEAVEVARRLGAEVPVSRVLLLTDAPDGEVWRSALAAGVWGLVSVDISPEQLAQSIRQVATGERVVDPEISAAALRLPSTPLTEQERAVLRLAGDGLPSIEIAAQLFLSDGTVRNYLSAAIRKTGARNRLEAARLARQKGWF